MATEREKAKERRREELVAAAAEIMAERGFHQARLGDVGAAVGISGPGIYRHFASKEELLAEILTEISIRLVDGAREVLARHRDKGEWDPAAVLRDLVDFHVQFAVTEPARIRVQEREIRYLAAGASEKVRSLQRTYLSLWADVLLELKPTLERGEARLRTQLAVGLINSSRHVVHWAGPEMTRDQAVRMAIASLETE